MRLVAFPMVCISIALVAAGCGTNLNTASVATRAASSVSAQSTVVTGDVAFDSSVSYKAIDILGVGPQYADKLAEFGITKVNELLTAGATRTARKHLVEETGISEKLVMTWVDHCDLMRVVGCGPEYARLLERAGVDTVPELASRNARSLAAALATANEMGGGKVCVHRLPSVATTSQWISNASTFERVVTY